MVDSEIAERFIDRMIGIVYEDSGSNIFRRGLCKDVTKTTLLLEFENELQAYTLKHILSIREVKNEEKE